MEIKEVLCEICGKTMQLYIEEHEYGRWGDEKTYHTYQVNEGINKEDLCICSNCLDNDDKILGILLDSTLSYINNLEERKQAIKNKYNEIIIKSIEKEENYNTELIKIYNRLNSLKSIGELEHNEISMIYNHHNKPQVPYTNIHYMIENIHNLKYREINNDKMMFSEWLSKYNIKSPSNAYLYSDNKFITEDTFKQELKIKLNEQEDKLSVKEYKDILNKINE